MAKLRLTPPAHPDRPPALMWALTEADSGRVIAYTLDRVTAMWLWKLIEDSTDTPPEGSTP